MQKGILKKWLCALVLICSMLLMFGCANATTDVATDVQPPVITAKQVIAEYGDELSYSDLVNVTDDSSDKVKLSVEKFDVDGIAHDEESQTITLGAIGTFEITVSATDDSGNTSKEKVSLVVEDHTQPVLLLSQTMFSMTAGDVAPNYMGVAQASDNVDGDLTARISVDASDVNYNSAGTYEVVYTVLDSSGNATVMTATVTVIAKPQTTSNAGTGGSQVMITKTGECYHTHKCGNGNYFWVSFSEAQSRGLRPCQKCY